MKILLCHNYYQQEGGEDHSFAAEARLLESHGHEVVRFTVHNDAIQGMSRWSVAKRAVWNREIYAELRQLIRRQWPCLMHCTNTFPLISPAAYYAASAEGIPVVQALRNYRLFCANAVFVRQGRVCEDCLGRRWAWPGVLYGCYRGSRAGSAAVSLMQGIHRLRGTWTRKVGVYFALTEFSRRKFIAGGLPAEKIAVKPNFVDPDPGAGAGGGGYAVFVGRLSEEKGLDLLLRGWGLAGELPLKIIGDGPLADRVQAACRQNPRIEWLGPRPTREVLSILGEADFLVVPSICYEHFPRAIVEGFAKGTPVLASRLGAMSELVDDGRTGLLFSPGDAGDLGAKVRRLLEDRRRLEAMRRAAREEYLEKYTGERNHRLLMEIYQRVLARDVKRGTAASRPGLSHDDAAGAELVDRDPELMTTEAKTR